jgi:hypothetical protein
MRDKYILVGQSAVPCDDLIEWATWFDTADRRVFKTLVGEYEVSTVFLGLDHNFHRLLTGEDSPPILFETMIFPAARNTHSRKGKTLTEWLEQGKRDEEGLDRELLDFQDRYPDWGEAEAGHDVAVMMVEERTGIKRTAPQLADVKM